MPTIRIACVGNKHRPILEQYAFKHLEQGDMLFLEAEPENEYDPHAVRILYDTEAGDRLHLGYVSRSMTEVIRLHLLDPYLVAFWNGENVTVAWGAPSLDAE